MAPVTSLTDFDQLAVFEKILRLPEENESRTTSLTEMRFEGEGELEATDAGGESDTEIDHSSEDRERTRSAGPPLV